MGRLESDNKVALAREPKQDRSRASFERVLDAATALLAEKGYSEFTLQELSNRSKVSIGSIYGRVNGKDDRRASSGVWDLGPALAKVRAAASGAMITTISPAKTGEEARPRPRIRPARRETK